MLSSKRCAVQPLHAHCHAPGVSIALTAIRARAVARRPQLAVRASYQQGGYQQGGYSQQGGYGQQQQGGQYYPGVPAYNPVEPSAPPLDPGTPTYASSASGYDPSSYASSVVLSEAEQQAAEDLEYLRSKAGRTRWLSGVAFWIQFALSLTSAGILLFSAAFVPQTTGFSVNDISKWLTAASVAAAFISSMFAHGFKTLSEKLINGGTVARGYVIGTLLTNNGICLAGIVATVIGLQASVGTLVAKTLMTATQTVGPYQYNPAGGVVSLDVFALQASTNTLLCHVVGLLFTNLMLRLINRK